MKQQNAADEVDGVGQLVLLVDLRFLGDDVGELVLENWDQDTYYELQSFGDLLVSKPHGLSPSFWQESKTKNLNFVILIFHSANTSVHA